MYSGTFPALLTPLTKKDEIDTHALCELIDFVLAKGVHGLYICGSTGEGILLTEEERRLVAETTVKHVAGRVPVIVHVGAPATALAARLARHAHEAGADAVASVPPFYFQVGQDGIKEHYRHIARATELPVYIYNIPASTNVNISADLVRTLFEEGTVRGLKFTSPDQLAFREILEACNGKLNAFSGPDQMLLSFLVMGAHGGIGTTYNFMPGLYVELFEAWRSGDIQRAQELQFLADRIMLIMKRYPYGIIPAAKATMRMLGIECGGPRQPMIPFNQTDQEKLRAELDEVGFFSMTPGGSA
jgi:N-acetylneuraminate lyase